MSKLKIPWKQRHLHLGCLRETLSIWGRLPELPGDLGCLMTEKHLNVKDGNYRTQQIWVTTVMMYTVYLIRLQESLNE